MLIHLQSNAVPSEWKMGYTGRKFRAQIGPSVTIYDSELHWGDGSRKEFFLIDGEKSKKIQPVLPWPNFGEQKISLRPGLVVIERIISCGKDMGIVVYACAEDVHPALMPPAICLADNEKMVLRAISRYKSSHGGRTRLQMLNEDLQGANKPGILPEDYALAIASLKAKGLLNTRGVLTIEGKNTAANLKM